MANSPVLARVAPSLVLAVMALSLGGSAQAGPPSVASHLDDPPPGVALGTRASTAALRAAAKIDKYPGKAGRKASAATTDVAATAVADVVPAGDPGVPTLAQHLSPSCSGTGTDGNRVQVIYAVDSGKTDRYTTLLPQLQSWVADVDDTVGVSAAKTGGNRRVRWVHNACMPVIAHEVLPAGTLAAGFNSTYTALKARGYTSAARKYLVFADDSALCGVGQMYNDSAKAATNANNGAYTMFARVDSPCWTFPAGWHSTPAHELMHTLGGVQNDSPNTTKASHCRDESDVMCYADGGLLGTMLSVCASMEHLLDCRNDDYFSTLPPAGSYLATHWNPADSSFLESVTPPTPAPTVAITGVSKVRAGLPATYTATASTADTTFKWTASPAACVPGAATAATVVVVCPSTYTGSVQLSLDGTRPGSATGKATKTITLDAATKATMTTTLTASPSTVTAGGSATLTAKLSYGTTPVRGNVTFYEWTTTGTWKALTSARDTGADGVSTFAVVPSRTTTYAVQASYAATGGWNPTTRVKTVVTRG